MALKLTLDTTIKTFLWDQWIIEKYTEKDIWSLTQSLNKQPTALPEKQNLLILQKSPTAHSERGETKNSLVHCGNIS